MIEITLYLNKLKGKSEKITILIRSVTHGLVAIAILTICAIDMLNMAAYKGKIKKMLETIASKLVATVETAIPIAASFLVLCLR